MADDPEDKDIERMLNRILGRIFGNQFGEEESDNPDDYPRSTEIKDDECLMLLTELQHKRRKMERQLSEARITHSEGNIVHGRLFIRLEDTYPMTAGYGPTHRGNGWRYWRGKYYYVSWDKVSKGEH